MYMRLEFYKSAEKKYQSAVKEWKFQNNRIFF